jgi:hypothetical protein
MRLPEPAPVALVAVDLLAAAATLAALGICVAACAVVTARRSRRRRGVDSWEAFERAFWSHVAGQPRSRRRSPGGR